MTSTEVRQALTAAVTARTEGLRTAESLTGRKATAAWKRVEELAANVQYAAQQVEMAVRAENPGTPEASIQAMVRAT